MEVLSTTVPSVTGSYFGFRPAFVCPVSARCFSQPRASSSLIKAALSRSAASPFAGDVSCAWNLEEPIHLSVFSSKNKRNLASAVIPVPRRRSRKPRQKPPPPDLPSYLFSNRIVYMGMCLLPEVQELLAAEFLYLQYEDSKKPIYLYINSTGTIKNGESFGYESEALSIYDIMGYVKPPIYTLCVGNAWGEAALLLAAGAKGNRAALPSSSIMLRQPIGRTEGQTTDIDIARREITELKKEIVKILAKHIGKSPEEIEADIYRPKYFSPSEAVEYGIIDKVLYNETATEDCGVSSEMKEYSFI